MSKSILDVKEVLLGLGVYGGLSLWLLASLREGRFSWSRSRLNLLVFLYLVWAGISISYSHFWWVSVSDYGRLLANVGLFLLTIVTVRSYAGVKRVAFAAAISGLLMAVYGLVQQFGAEPLAVRWMNTEGRIFSFATNPTYLAGYAVLLLPVLVAVGVTGSHGNEEANEETAETRRRRVIPGMLLVMAASVLIFDRLFEGQPSVFIIFAGALGIVTLAAALLGLERRVRPRRPPRPAVRAAYGLVVLLLGATLLLSLTFARSGDLALGAAAAGVLTLVRARGKPCARCC